MRQVHVGLREQMNSHNSDRKPKQISVFKAFTHCMGVKICRSKLTYNSKECMDGKRSAESEWWTCSSKRSTLLDTHSLLSSHHQQFGTDIGWCFEQSMGTLQTNSHTKMAYQSFFRARFQPRKENTTLRKAGSSPTGYDLQRTSGEALAIFPNYVTSLRSSFK